jgi:hypothetical protein
MTTTPTISEKIDEVIDYTRFEQEWAATQVKDHDPKTPHEKDCGVCVKLRVLKEQARNELLAIIADFAERITPEKRQPERGLQINPCDRDTCGMCNRVKGHNACVDLITQNVKAELGAAPINSKEDE